MKAANFSAASEQRDTAKTLEEKLARNFVVILVMAFLGTAVQIAECYWLWAHGGETDAACEVLKLCSSFFTLWLVAFLFLYYRRKFELLKATNALLAQDTLASSELLASWRTWSFLPEALAYLVHAPPFLCAEFTVPFYDLRRSATYTTTLNTDELAAIFMLFSRALLLVRATPYISGLSTRHNCAYANLNHLNVTTWLSVRMTYLRMPGRMLCSVSALLLLMLGFAMQVAERRVNRDLDEYLNCVWLVLVSMTGIGFGDLYPMTGLGRLISTLSFMWGALLAALLVFVMMEFCKLLEIMKKPLSLSQRISPDT